MLNPADVRTALVGSAEVAVGRTVAPAVVSVAPVCSATTVVERSVPVAQTALAFLVVRLLLSCQSSSIPVRH